MKFCAGNYKTENIELLNLFDAYIFGLSDFQKYAIEGIVSGNNVLVTAHTGSGKTLPAEFAITFFNGKGKKVIYTSPIKALSNQKFYEFTQKFPEISIGLLTGDIKMNPGADVLIMTTEILQKQLYNPVEFQTFDMDFNDLGCVIFDEVHYINDAERGHVWEETIMNLPDHVQMVMLSATINNPQNFASWCETNTSKEVWLIPTYSRIVPLTHYGFVSTNASCFKIIKDKEKQKEIRAFTNKLVPIKTPDGLFHEKEYYEFEKFKEIHKKNNIRVTTRHVLNEVCNFMVEKEMLPALCFVLSRKQLEKCAKGITSVLLEDDSKVPYIIQKECETIIRRLPNFKEYLNLPEYHEMVKLLEKGIAIHHAGVMPVLREMVEILYAKGYIKLLFATETFAVGVNMPTKTVLFTDVHKHDGNDVRVLHPHEYTQMAGRAGRRGIDKVGSVILLYNLFSPELISHRTMLYGQPAKLESKFKISPMLVLNLIATKTDITKFLDKTMMTYEINEYNKSLLSSLGILNKKVIPELLVFPLEEYDRLTQCVKTHTNRKRKDFQKQLDELLVQFPDPDLPKIREQYEISLKIKEIKETINNESTEIVETMNFLESNGFVEYSENVPQLTTLGVVASQLNEADPLILSKLIVNGLMLPGKKLAKLFSCFTEIRVNEDCITYRISDKEIGDLLEGYDLHYDLLEYVEEWYDCENEEMCKMVIQRMEREKGIFLGDFVKAMLKIVNIAREVEKVAIYLNIPLMEPVSQIPNALLKFMVNNQSLYI